MSRSISPSWTIAATAAAAMGREQIASCASRRSTRLRATRMSRQIRSRAQTLRSALALRGRCLQVGLRLSHLQRRRKSEIAGFGPRRFRLDRLLGVPAGSHGVERGVGPCPRRCRRFPPQASSPKTRCRARWRQLSRRDFFQPPYLSKVSVILASSCFQRCISFNDKADARIKWRYRSSALREDRPIATT